MSNETKDKNSSRNMAGFTLLELLIVMSLVTLILGLSTVFFANSLPSNTFNATVREIVATIRYARTLAQSNGESQTLTIDLDSKKYGIKGRSEKSIPTAVNINVVDPISGEIRSGKYTLVFHSIGGSEGGTVVLRYKKRKVNINLDPIVGATIE
jgi:general secretion pathway protein H